MVDLKFTKQLIKIGTALGFTLPSEISKQFKLEKGMTFELDVIEEPDLILIFKRVETEKQIAKEVEPNEEN